MLAGLVAVVAATALYTNTETVAAVEERDGALWVTTTGGRRALRPHDPDPHRGHRRRAAGRRRRWRWRRATRARARPRGS
jgi:hypothetical protein